MDKYIYNEQTSTYESYRQLKEYDEYIKSLDKTGKYIYRKGKSVIMDGALAENDFYARYKDHKLVTLDKLHCSWSPVYEWDEDEIAMNFDGKQLRRVRKMPLNVPLFNLSIDRISTLIDRYIDKYRSKSDVQIIIPHYGFVGIEATMGIVVAYRNK